jgi:hypothetical protein
MKSSRVLGYLAAANDPMLHCGECLLIRLINWL